LSQAQSNFVLPGDLIPGVSAGGQENPAIASGSNGYLVVWEDNRSSQGGFVKAPNGLHANRDVYAARLDTGGNLVDATPIVVNQDPFDQVTPQVAWNGENYLVVWKSSRSTQSYVTSGIYAARVSPAGVVLDDPAIVIEDGDDFDERDPFVASDGTNWTVFYTDYRSGAPSEDLDGAVVSPAGFLTQKQTVVAGSQFNQPVNVDVRWAIDRYLVVYEKGYQGAYGRFLASTLSPIGGELTFATSANKPEVATNGTDFFVSFSGARGTPVARDGTIAIPGGATYLGSGSTWGPETDCAWDGTHWVLGFSTIGLGGNPSFLYLSQITPAGALVPGSPATVASTSTIRAFAVGDGTGGAQVVWDDWSVSGAQGNVGDLDDVFGTRVASDMTLGPRVPITVSAPAQVIPSIAGSSGKGWLVAYLSHVSGTTRVHAQRLAGDGAPIDLQPIVLHVGTRVIRRIDCAFDGSEWLVVWDDNFGTLRHTFGVRVALDGTVLDPAPINLLRGERPAVAAAEGTRTFLLASWDHNQSNEFIRATRIDGASGTPLDAPYLTLGVGSGFPDAIGFDDRWLVVWGGVAGCFVDLGGVPGTPFLVASGLSETVHGLARDGDMALVAFSRHNSTSANANIHARRMLKDGTFLDASTQGFPVCQASNLQFDPRAAFDGTDFHVTWTDYSIHPALVPGLGDARIARVLSDGTVPTLCGDPLVADLRVPEGDVEVGGGNGGWISAVVVLHPEAPYGGLRIEIRSSGSQPFSAPFCFGDGSGGPCPCGNVGIGGHGCANSLNPQGALLTASGQLNPDSLVLSGSGMPATSLCIYLQGDAVVQTAFGDGLRCAGGSLIRLAVKSNLAGASAFPEDTDTLSISQRGQVALGSGETRYYQTYYRNPTPGFCTSETFNVSNGILVRW
jgi:hypothetical protein